MSDTPETDAFFFRTDIEWDDEVEFARKLERERDIAKSELRRLTEKLGDMWEANMTIGRERDEAQYKLEDARQSLGFAIEEVERLKSERDEALSQIVQAECRAERFCQERDEAQATLTDIHRWIERNHPDGFIDSLTFYQNLERVVDRWYDRLEK